MGPELRQNALRFLPLVLGAAMISAGLGMLLGLAAALIIAGVLTIALTILW